MGACANRIGFGSEVNKQRRHLSLRRKSDMLIRNNIRLDVAGRMNLATSFAPPDDTPMARVRIVNILFYNVAADGFGATTMIRALTVIPVNSDSVEIIDLPEPQTPE